MKLYFDLPKDRVINKMPFLISFLIGIFSTIWTFYISKDNPAGKTIAYIMTGIMVGYIGWYIFEILNHSINMDKNPNYKLPLMLPKFEYIDGHGSGDTRNKTWNYEIKLKNIGETAHILKIIPDDVFTIKFRPDAILAKNRETQFFVSNLKGDKDKKASFVMEIRDENNKIGKIKCICHIDQRHMETVSL
jgi:hypothetical protein